MKELQHQYYLKRKMKKQALKDEVSNIKFILDENIQFNTENMDYFINSIIPLF